MFVVSILSEVVELLLPISVPMVASEKMIFFDDGYQEGRILMMIIKKEELGKASVCRRNRALQLISVFYAKEKFVHRR